MPILRIGMRGRATQEGLVWVDGTPFVDPESACSR